MGYDWDMDETRVCVSLYMGALIRERLYGSFYVGAFAWVLLYGSVCWLYVDCMLTVACTISLEVSQVQIYYKNPLFNFETLLLSMF